MSTLGGQSLLRLINNKEENAVLNLLQGGTINLDERNESGETFLMVAGKLGQINVVKELVADQTVDVNAIDNDNWTALLNASKEGNEEIVEILIDSGANVDHKDMGGWTALMWACYKGHLNVAKILLDRQANPNVKGEHHMSCLTWAAGRGYEEIVNILLSNGATVNTADKYGTTPLIWAARKGHTSIVKKLLDEGATVDNAGMYSYTALIVAAKGGFTDVVNTILQFNPNVNATDKDGFSALTRAAKDGHTDIVSALVHANAYVNLPDRDGDSILIYAAKGGHLEVVRLLLKKYADVDVAGADNKTALYWAVEKGHAAIVKQLLEFNANTELANKDGDTPLLKSVRSRNHEIVKLLLNKGAKTSATDRKGDTALHISVRARSKKVTELLLRNPKDGRLLYKPNRIGQTPYQIDTAQQKSVLTQVFGTRNLNADDNIQGYELYSSTIADVLSEPSLHTPITVGLYAKWGSGKSLLISKLIQEMKTFTKHSSVPVFEFSFIQFFICFFISAVIGLVLGFTVMWPVGLGVGLGILALQYIFLVIVWAGVSRHDWDWAYFVSVYLARKLQTAKLLLVLMFKNKPAERSRETSAVKFLFTDNARLASVVGEKSIVAMIATLCEALEKEYGSLVARLYKVLKPKSAKEHGQFKSICCIPYFLIVLFVLACIIAGATLLGIFGITKFSENAVVYGVIIGLGIVVGLAILVNLYTMGQMIFNIMVPPKRRVQKIGANIASLKMEGFMQALKKEVEILGHMTNTMDIILNTHTRLVVVVDGLDSCEQEKLLQVLDVVHMLFGDKDSPFITVLAVDPHVIIKGIEHNLQGLFRDSSINGYDYLKNIVQLPFFLQAQTMPRNRQAAQRYDSDSGKHKSQLSLVGEEDRPRKKSRKSQGDLMQFGSTSLSRQPSAVDLSKSLGKNTYFSDVNPRNMKRLMNILAVTGRLLRAHHIDFNWYKLAAWINITEQWPYRMSWLILDTEDNEDIEDPLTLKTLYESILPKMPPSKDFDRLLEIDRDGRKLDIFLKNHMPILTVGDIRRFLPCTINVDPYLRKLIRELQQNAENLQYEIGSTIGSMTIEPSAAQTWPYRRVSSVAARMNAMSPKPEEDNISNLQGNLYKRRSSMPASSLTTRSEDQRGGLYQRRSINVGVMSPTPRTEGPSWGNNAPSSPPTPSAQPMKRNMSFNRLGVASPQQVSQAPYHGYLNPMQQMMMGPYDYQQQQGVSQTPQKLRGSPKVHVQSQLYDQKLSTLNVNAVCELLSKIDGINTDLVPKYCENVLSNNINGAVLETCELDELKPVMCMCFGDWQLFKTVIQTMREKELYDDLHDSGDEVERPQFTKKVPSSNYHGIIAPQPTYAGSAQKRTQNVSSQWNKQKPMGGKTFSSASAHMRKKDSFVGDVIMECEYLNDIVDAVGVGDVTDSDDEGLTMADTTLSTVIDMEGVNLVDIENHVNHTGNHTMENSINHNRDKSSSGFTVGYNSDDNSGDSLVLSEMHAFPRSKKSKKKSKENVSKSGSRGSISSVASSAKHTAPPPETDSDGLCVQSEDDNVPFVTDGAKKKKGFSLALRPGSSKKSLNSEVMITEETGEALPSDQAFAYADTLSSQATSPTPSVECVALRKLVKSNNDLSPSAFKVLTPGSSRASSPGSTRGSRKQSTAGSGVVFQGEESNMDRVNSQVDMKDESEDNILL